MTVKKPKSKAVVHLSRAERARRRLLRSAGRDSDTLLIQYDNSIAGYDEEDVEEMREEHGVNVITRQTEDSLFKRFVGAFINPFSVVLIILAAVSLFTDVIWTAPGASDFTAITIIMTMVLASGMIRFIQELRSDNAAKHLSEMVETTVAVARKFHDKDSGDTISEKKEIPMDEIVVGDVIHLAAGDMVPADVRILSAKDLFVSQSALTGESEPVEKFARAEKSITRNPLELNNLSFMGTNVISGSATALVITVGDDTILGSIAQQLQTKAPPTSFEKGVNSVSWVLIRFMLIMVPVVLLVNGFTKGNWFEALLFALSVAVGLTPEMLPMIVSANLAKGAVSMSRKRVIVKSLNSIQNFGAMDILCTDKTGTITQDKVILELHLDIHGNDNIDVLRYAFLNSYYQTGLKNLMDISIINFAREAKLTNLWIDYKKIDEIPFDFNRRRMSVAMEKPDGKVDLITKGAIEEMLSISSMADYNNAIKPITDEIRGEILDACAKLNNKGMRVLGLARKSVDIPESALSAADENEMIFMGYLAFLDPPKESAEAAIKALGEYGVKVKVLTGDNDGVTRTVCRSVGIDAKRILLGSEVEEMSEEQLKKAVDDTDVFAKLSPSQKARIVTALREDGHTVGFMGDGINDAAAMRAADVGISVDTAVDIAKESANIILLEKDLMVLEEGLIEGRKIYANIIKYIKLTASSNFGNMLSVLAASAFLPFLPMLPIQILVLNLIYDISCIAIPWDNVDQNFLRKPRKWDASSISRFMLWLGPVSSIFDIATYCLLFFIICPQIAGGHFAALDGSARITFIMLFHTGWFVQSLWSQTLVIHMIRTPKIPFIQSRASTQVTLLTTLGIAVGTIIPFTWLGSQLNMTHLPLFYFPWLIGIILAYMALITVMKKVFVWKYGELL
ncbi:MAG: magnesium-translocating P-type ATPase [Treponema sp.]|jgi:Mg2+-importing ATPase|nr:magnesium-translocating P-type ATPase [Treponema sp.]